jgi:hypothetical protein
MPKLKLKKEKGNKASGVLIVKVIEKFIYRGKIGTWCLPCAKEIGIKFKLDHVQKPGTKVVDNKVICSKCKKELAK